MNQPPALVRNHQLRGGWLFNNGDFMEDLSNVFEECEKYLRTALSRWRKQLPELYEDAFQEGMIQCWRDVEAGITPKLKILRRASMHANGFMHRNGEYYFGKPKKSRDGLRTNAAAVEKVKVYLNETRGIRNGIWPGPMEVSKALGINHSSTQKILTDIREGRIDHMVYREDGRMDWDFYKTMSVEVLNTTSDTDKELRHWTDDVRFAETFEDIIVSDMDMERILKQLTEKHRTVLYMYFYQGYTPVAIGEHFGHRTNVSTKGHRHVRNAIHQASILVHPYQGKCERNHARTEINTLIKCRRDGNWFRMCQTCKTEDGHKTVVKQRTTGFRTGRKERPYCPKGHKKDVRDSRGALRCRQCRAEAQKAYTARKRAERESS